jgi:hypothetical protein
MTKKKESFQSVLVNIIIHLLTLETEEVFAAYQIQDLFCSGLICIFTCSNRILQDVHLHIHLDVFTPTIERQDFKRKNFNRKFWRILDMMAKIKIMEVELNRKEVYKLDRFFPRNIFKFFEKESLKTFEDLIDCRDFYSLLYFSGKDIYSFLGGFEELYSHLYCLSKADSSPTKESRIKKSFEFTLLQKILRLKKMENVFEFHTLEIEKFFGRDVSRLLKESGLNTIKDLIDFDNIYNRISLFPEKQKQEFNREFSRVYYCFCFLEEMKKRT